MTSLKDRSALVTGVTSGIGHATATRLIEQGALVLGLGRDETALDGLLERLGPRFEPVLCDLTDAQARQRVVELLQRRQPPIDILVNNAAECAFDSALSISPERLAQLFSVNVLAALELAQAAAKRMPAGSHIIQLSSITARHVANASFAPYAATKQAVEALTDALRWELHPKGIHVSTVLPGLVDTSIYQKVAGFESTLEKLKRQVPEWLTPANVADVILLILTSPDNVVLSEVVLLPRQQGR
jgi:NAD(P)-dependent dehydrogenase (short-subunit alcohol dehydrogenase family)